MVETLTRPFIDRATGAKEGIDVPVGIEAPVSKLLRDRPIVCEIRRFGGLLGARYLGVVDVGLVDRLQVLGVAVRPDAHATVARHPMRRVELQGRSVCVVGVDAIGDPPTLTTDHAMASDGHILRLDPDVEAGEVGVELLRDQFFRALHSIPPPRMQRPATIERGSRQRRHRSGDRGTSVYSV
ncbi:MAG: hypothetical protein ACJ77A_16210 [Actinomycetota bacterium]